MTSLLKFSPANAKTKELRKVEAIAAFLGSRLKIYSCDLLSGWSCPFAKDCLSKATLVEGDKLRIVDGPDTVFRCFSASQEVQYKNVYNSRKHNFDLLKACKTGGQMANLISDSMPKNLGVCRIHVAGDFFNQRYFDAWLQVAKHNPHRLFYAYTKNLGVWIRRKHIVDNLPNFVLTASYGGKRDDLIESKNLRYAKVFMSDFEAYSNGLEIDHDDSHAANPHTKGNSFALLIHGTQPAGSLAAKAVKSLKGVGSYSRKGGAK